MPWLKTDATHYHSQLRLTDKKHEIVGRLSAMVEAFGPDKRSGPGMVLTVP